ncbi:MAG: hypothetical protein KC549_17905 [Myxococcales bacterium]|nr:hypothetical protein [Myxococcales bacterium]MCB9546150.1 hypothetical protein [Myxococcales bacterium]
MLDKLKEKGQGVQAKVSELVGAAQVRGADEVARLAAAIAALGPDLAELGYRVVGAKVTLSVPPSAHFRIAGLTTPVDPARFDALAARRADDITAVALFRALKHVAGVQARVDIPGLRADRAEISLAVPPAISLLFD